MTQNEGAGRKRAGDEGALYTGRIMGEITRLRNSKQPRWSAERLAEEMTAAGVPWTRDAVSNLETGRRKHIAVHELLALAWVLDVANPADLLVPPGSGLEESMFPVTPSTMVAAATVRAWLRGETGPLRQALTEGEPGDLAELLGDDVPEAVRRDLIAIVRSHRMAEQARQSESGDGSR